MKRQTAEPKGSVPKNSTAAVKWHPNWNPVFRRGNVLQKHIVKNQQCTALVKKQAPS
ncbi:MAG: hypothetical protein ACJAZP_000571 [Psychromonas sp.]|jgi:hypothetical protein